MSPSAPEVSASSSPFDELMRGAEFWRRATSIYGSYKLAQLRALVLRHTRGMSAEQLKHE
ncbi:lysM domain-containing protein, partial [Haematococcus lacustris]